ncbi:MAG: flagella basal body P-ring formation protein FlgA [Paracoccaceae bacterium]|jgi:flagella basal body P-ring formation protein FlgA
MQFFILTIIAAAIAFAGFAPAYAQVSLRAAVSVDTPEVTVRDVFPGAQSEAVIAKTPAPGRRLILDAYTLQRIAKRHNIQWRASTRFEQSVVTRQSRVLSAAEIETTLRRSLIRQGLSDSHQVELSNRSLNIRVATNTSQPYFIENSVMDRRSGRVSAFLTVGTETGEKLKYRLDGFTFSVIEIPVPNRRIRRGEVINTGDVIWKKIRKDDVGRNVVRDRKTVIGQSARRYLAANRKMMIDDLEAPKLVRKGSLVTIYLETSNLRLTAKARASEDGALNQTIRVVNVRSRRTVEAIVRSASRVIIPSENTVTN